MQVLREEQYQFGDGSIYKWRIHKDHLNQDRFNHLYIAPKNEKEEEIYEDELIIKAKIIEALEFWFMFNKIDQNIFNEYFNFAGYFNDVEFQV